MGIKLNGVYMKDELNLNNLKNGNYIMNLQNHDQEGSHWCAIVKKGKELYYFDPFGEFAPENEQQIFIQQHDFVHYSKYQVQNVKSKYCGCWQV